MADPRVVLITGAFGGLGEALVQAFASRGDVVIRQSRDPGRGDVHGDLTSDGDVATMIGEILDRHGRIDVVVNNAADQMIGEPGAPDAARWIAMLDTTLLSAVRVSEAAAERMVPGSSIVNVSSVEATLAFPGRGPYAAAKSALEAFTRSLAVDLGARGIRANAIAPGLIEREGLAASWPQGHASWTADTPRGRIVSASEVAEVAVFLASPAASGVSGVVVPVDAGWSASGRIP
ncbi:MAG: SDR family NAD(P)-dependent oxidoreductase [Candidatus Nanopelagicales bacterium]